MNTKRLLTWLVGVAVVIVAGVALAEPAVPIPPSPVEIPSPTPASPSLPMVPPPVRAPGSPTPTSPSEFDHHPTQPPTLDDWAVDQVDKPLAATERLLPTVGLTEPPLLAPSQAWVRTGYWSAFALGVMLLLGAWLNHSRHMLKGTDLLRGRHPLSRLAAPAICLVAMFLVPWGWEFLRVSQEFVWSADAFDRSDPQEVMAVVLPPMTAADTGTSDNSPVPTSTNGKQAESSTPPKLQQPPVPLCTDAGAYTMDGTQKPCRDPKTQRVEFPVCPPVDLIERTPLLGEVHYPCYAPVEGAYHYPSCTYAAPGSPCHEWAWYDLFGNRGPVKYPVCGSEIPGLPCADSSDRHTPLPETNHPSQTSPPPAVPKKPATASAPIPPPVPRAGSVRVVADKLGTTVGVGTGLAVLVLGLLALLKYLIGRLLVAIAPIILGLTAYSDRIEPTVAWLNVLVRTSLLLSVYNFGWWAMRHLPGWMSFVGLDAVVFIVAVLPAMIVAIWALWVRPLWGLIKDPLLMRGGAHARNIGRRATAIGRLLTFAGGVVGAPALASVGATVRNLGMATARTGVAAQLATMQSSRLSHTDNLCWVDGSEYVTLVHGVPTWSPTQPPGTVIAGPWTGNP